MKRHLPLAAILVLAFAVYGMAQPQATASPSPKPKPRAPRVTNAELQKQLVEMENALWNAWKNKDAKPFETHLSANSVMVSENGVSGKQDMTKELASMPCEIKSFTLSDWKMTKYDADAALLTYKGVTEGTCGGQPIPAAWASSLWVRKNGTRQAAFHQETPAK